MSHHQLPQGAPHPYPPRCMAHDLPPFTHCPTVISYADVSEINRKANLMREVPPYYFAFLNEEIAKLSLCHTHKYLAEDLAGFWIARMIRNDHVNTPDIGGLPALNGRVLDAVTEAERRAGRNPLVPRYATDSRQTTGATCHVRHARRFPVPGDCPICYMTVLPWDTSVAWCKQRCGNNFHASCIAEWHRNQRPNLRQVECPMCREPWPQSNCSHDIEGGPVTFGTWTIKVKETESMPDFTRGLAAHLRTLPEAMRHKITIDVEENKQKKT